MIQLPQREGAPERSEDGSELASLFLNRNFQDYDNPFERKYPYIRQQIKLGYEPEIEYFVLDKIKVMTVIKIELIDPRAQVLLEDLAKLNLIKIQEIETSKQRFSALLSRLRSKKEEAPGLEEITEEVESVRSARKGGNG